jgi:hypothetical protein
MGKANFGIALESTNGVVQAGSHMKGEVWVDVSSEIKVSRSSKMYVIQSTSDSRLLHLTLLKSKRDLCRARRCMCR